MTRFVARRAVAALSLALLAGASHAEPPRDGLRVVTWNITNYSGGAATALQTVVYGEFEGRSMDPDVILLQEINSQSAVNQIVSALNSAPGSPGDWAAGAFYPASSIEPAMVYRTSRMTLSQSQRLWAGGVSPNHPRSIVRYDLHPVGYPAQATTVAMYSSHMKAGSSSTDQARKLLEAERIRDDAAGLPAGWHFIYGGDTNIQRSTWAAYRELVENTAEHGATGKFFDPISTPGSWNNQVAFRFVHTQDPSSSAGMDDRFDHLLISQGLVDGNGFDYIGNFGIPYSTTTWNDPNHTFRSWGNDGTSFNTMLRTTGNTMVGPAIAQAIISLGANAGHCPVFLDLRLPAVADVESTVLHFGTIQVGETAPTRSFGVANGGDVAEWGVGGIDTLDYTLTATAPFVVAAGLNTAAPGAAPNTETVSVNTSTAGVFSGGVSVLSDDPSGTVEVTAVARIVDCIADWDGTGTVNVFDILAYLDGFSLGDLSNDLTGDLAITIFDLLAYLDRFETGCP